MRIDLTGQKFGMLTVDSYAGSKGGMALWNCTCDCGNHGVYKGRYLRSGDTKSCGCLKTSGNTNHMAMDIAGQLFGRLTAKYVSCHSPRKWHCICECGNEVDVLTNCLLSGHTQSCGCYHKEMTRSKQMIDITGRRFGRLIVEQMDGSENIPLMWRCVCDCGNRIVVDGVSLRSGNTKSCGCLRHDASVASRKKDLTNMRFGRLVALEEIGQQKQHLFVWKCICDCGCECFVPSASLLSGNTKSCGCMKSGPEDDIAQFLIEHGIQYERQREFAGCKDKARLPFDFYLPGYNIAIEYDGEFHYIDFPKLGNDLAGQQRRDDIKTKYCEENDIILLRIPYWEKDNIESILSDWLFLNNGADTNSATGDLSA